MPNAKLHLVEDVHFIFREVARLQAIQNQWFETKNFPIEPQHEFLYELAHPTDKHIRFPCGRAGMVRLEELSRVAAQRAGIANQIEVRTIRTPLAKSLVRRFVVEGREISVTQIERALSEAARIGARSISTTTHFIPCHLMTSQSPETFEVGPIKFLNRKAFRHRIAEGLWKSRRDNQGAGRYIKDVTGYYKAFGWVAEVSIIDCDEQTSESSAVQAVTYALDCLHLFFGPSHTSRMVVGGPAIHQDRRGKFTVENGGLTASSSYGGPGEVGFNDDWPKFFDSPDAAHLLALIGAALEAAVDPKQRRPVSERFLDAVSWYGEGTREKVNAARIIKYVTALERMLMTDEKDNITDLVSQRAAAFCSDYSIPGDFPRWRAKCQSAYGLRSKLVHGSLSQRNIDVTNGIWEVQEVTRRSILNALAAFGHAGLRAETVKRKELANWFNQIVTKASEVESS